MDKNIILKKYDIKIGMVVIIIIIEISFFAKIIINEKKIEQDECTTHIQSITEADIIRFNLPFLNYIGENFQGPQLFALLKEIEKNNINEFETGKQRFVKLQINGKNGGVVKSETYGGNTNKDYNTNFIILDNNKWEKSVLFEIKITQINDDGLVQEITASEK